MIKLIDLLHGIAGVFSEGRYRTRLICELREYLGVRHIFLLSSGKAALTLILRALHAMYPGRNEVIIPAYTCYSVPSAIVKSGMKIVLCDVDPETLDFDTNRLVKTITNKTLCIIPTHFFGIPADMLQMQKIGRKKGVLIVEDAAQAMGSSFQGKRLGTLGDVGFFSLGRGKNITCGSGGIIVTDSDAIAEAISAIHADLPGPSFMIDMKNLVSLLLMSVFIHPAFYWLPAGLPFLKLGQTIFDRDFPVKRLSGSQAGILRHWRRSLETSNEARKSISSSLRAHLGLAKPENEEAPLLRFPIICATQDDRDDHFARLRVIGMGASKMYPGPVNEIPEISEFFTGSRFPGAKALSARILTVPTHHHVRMRDIERIGELLKPSTGKRQTDLLIAGNR
jgi:dTDP-4-amino-4,6-dideoxygalactose transaminase